MVFPVVMYGCESWTIKKAEHRIIDAFELWCWRRLLRVPWTARRSNQSILKEISPGCSLEGRILKLKLQYFGHLIWRADSFEETLMLVNIEGRRRKGTTEHEMVGWHHWHNGHGFVWIPGVGDGKGGLAYCCSWGHKELDTTEWLNWTELFIGFLLFITKAGAGSSGLLLVSLLLLLSLHTCHYCLHSSFPGFTFLRAACISSVHLETYLTDC